MGSKKDSIKGNSVLDKMLSKFPMGNILTYDSWVSDVVNPNNFSYWYERVKGISSELKIPASEYHMFTFQDMMWLSPLVSGDDVDKVGLDKLVRVVEELSCKFSESTGIGSGLVFLKNARFSDKFDFSHCVCDIADIDGMVRRYMDINFNGLMVGAGGTNELVVREFIPNKFPYGTIYNGLPLRPEFRVFYDFDEKKVLYSVNYWDLDYCAGHLADEDFNTLFNASRSLEDFYNKNKDRVESIVEKTFNENNVWLRGKWSIDIMACGENDFYLIDMAVAERSAYWDAEKANKVCSK